MNLELRLAALVSEMVRAIQILHAHIGRRADLTTVEKSTIVGAINEIDSVVLVGGFTLPPEVETQIQEFKNTIIAGASPTYDTFQKIYNAMQSANASLILILAGLTARVRFDVPQSLQEIHKRNAVQSIGGVSQSDIGTDYDLAGRLREQVDAALLV